MKVREVITQLSGLPPEMEVEVWDQPQCDYVSVTGVIWEDGDTAVHILIGGETILSEGEIDENF